jgi:hypothetical protein
MCTQLLTYTTSRNQHKTRSQGDLHALSEKTKVGCAGAVHSDSTDVLCNCTVPGASWRVRNVLSAPRNATSGYCMNKDSKRVVWAVSNLATGLQRVHARCLARVLTGVVKAPRKATSGYCVHERGEDGRGALAI